MNFYLKALIYSSILTNTQLKPMLNENNKNIICKDQIVKYLLQESEEFNTLTGSIIKDYNKQQLNEIFIIYLETVPNNFSSTQFCSDVFTQGIKSGIFLNEKFHNNKNIINLFQNNNFTNIMQEIYETHKNKIIREASDQTIYSKKQLLKSIQNDYLNNQIKEENNNNNNNLK